MSAMWHGEAATSHPVAASPHPGGQGELPVQDLIRIGAEARPMRPEADRTRWLERFTFSLAVIAQLAIRVLYVLHHPADVDEPQHLHVIWGWTRGLVQYRDVFDNHAPLFHLAMSPLIGALGERPDLLLYARWMMVPLVALSLWATYRLGEALWSARVGRWAALLAGFVPSFLLTSVEFRADILWMTAW